VLSAARVRLSEFVRLAMSVNCSLRAKHVAYSANYMHTPRPYIAYV